MTEEKTLPIATPSVIRRYAFLSLGFFSFAIPFFFSKSQILTGTFVNSALFLTAIFLPKKYFLPIIIFPSLAVLSRGLIFGPFTPFLVYFLPAIWLGNFLLIFTFRKFSAYANFFLNIFFASLFKWAILNFTAKIYFSLHLVPQLFL